MQYVTLVLAIFGALGTIITWIHGIITTRKKISFEIVNAIYSDDLVYAFCILSNKSRLPIAINSISLHYNKKNIFCEKISKKLFEKSLTKGTVVTNREEIKSEQFPISLNGLLGSSGYIIFHTKGCNFKKEEKVDINLYTSRGIMRLKGIDLHYIEDFTDMI